MKTSTSKDKMKTPQQIRNEVEKEIEDLYDIWYKEINKELRLRNEENKQNPVKMYFEDKAKLSILTEYDKSIKEMIEDLYLNKCKEQNLDKTEWTEAEMFSLNELLSKIGDNSEVEK